MYDTLEKTKSECFLLKRNVLCEQYFSCSKHNQKLTPKDQLNVSSTYLKIRNDENLLSKIKQSKGNVTGD